MDNQNMNMDNFTIYFNKSPVPQSLIINIDSICTDGFKYLPVKNIIFQIKDKEIIFEIDELITILEKLKGLI